LISASQISQNSQLSCFPGILCLRVNGKTKGSESWSKRSHNRGNQN
jgi:hypothetical protein